MKIFGLILFVNHCKRHYHEYTRKHTHMHASNTIPCHTIPYSTQNQEDIGSHIEINKTQKY